MKKNYQLNRKCQPLQNHTTNQPATSCETFRGFATPTVVGKPSLFKSRKETSDSFQIFKYMFPVNSAMCVLWFALSPLTIQLNMMERP